MNCYVTWIKRISICSEADFNLDKTRIGSNLTVKARSHKRLCEVRLNIWQRRKQAVVHAVPEDSFVVSVQLSAKKCQWMAPAMARWASLILISGIKIHQTIGKVSTRFPECNISLCAGRNGSKQICSESTDYLMALEMTLCRNISGTSWLNSTCRKNIPTRLMTFWTHTITWSLDPQSPKTAISVKLNLLD